MTKEEIMNELDTIIGKANIKLANMIEEVEDLGKVVIINDHGLVKSGDNDLGRVSDEMSLKKAKKAIWDVVDSTRETLTKQDQNYENRENCEKHEKQINGIEDVMSILSHSVKVANEKLADMTKGGFPFSFEEVKIAVDHDSAGIYANSGKTPIGSFPRHGNPEAAIRDLKARIFETVDATRAAIDRRAKVKADADALKAEGAEKAKAAEALKAAGISTSIIGIAVDDAAAKRVSDAAKKAAREANKHPFVGDVEYKTEWKISVDGYAGGLVVSVGGKPCMVTRFPKTGSAKTLDRMVSFIQSDIKAIGDSRRAYFERVSIERARMNSLREIAAKLDAAESQLKASVM